MDGDGQHPDVGESVFVPHGVVEGFTQAGAWIEGVDQGVAVVDDIEVAAVGVDRERAVEASQGRTHRAGRSGPLNGAGADGAHGAIQGRGIAIIHIGVVVQHVAAGRAAGRGVQGATGLQCGAGVIHRHGGVVGPVEDDG